MFTGSSVRSSVEAPWEAAWKFRGKLRGSSVGTSVGASRCKVSKTMALPRVWLLLNSCTARADGERGNCQRRTGGDRTQRANNNRTHSRGLDGRARGPRARGPRARERTRALNPLQYAKGDTPQSEGTANGDTLLEALRENSAEREGAHVRNHRCQRCSRAWCPKAVIFSLRMSKNVELFSIAKENLRFFNGGEKV